MCEGLIIGCAGPGSSYTHVRRRASRCPTVGRLQAECWNSRPMALLLTQGENSVQGAAWVLSTGSTSSAVGETGWGFGVGVMGSRKRGGGEARRGKGHEAGRVSWDLKDEQDLQPMETGIPARKKTFRGKMWRRGRTGHGLGRSGEGGGGDRVGGSDGAEARLMLRTG